MDKTIFESFEDYLEEADYPQGKKKIRRSAVDLMSTKAIMAPLPLTLLSTLGSVRLPYLSILKRKLIC